MSEIPKYLDSFEDPNLFFTNEAEELTVLDVTDDRVDNTQSKETNNDELDMVINVVANDKKNILILNTDLEIVYFSPFLQDFFSGYYHIEKKPFFNVFRNVLQAENLQKFLHSLRSEAKGYSWTDLLTHQTSEKRQIYTHMDTMPLFGSGRRLIAYLVTFENVTERVRDGNRKMLLSLLEASKLKDNDTGFHNERVNYYSYALAEELRIRKIFPQIDSEYVEKIGFFAAMHDIGKIGIPDDILQKKGSLTESEWKIMREHTINGSYILAFYPERMAKEIALSHHERWDGSGYPYNLEGEMIPLSARIVMVADVYDALRMKRCYKPAFSHEKTVKHIISGSGSHFDPRIVDVFKECHPKLEAIFNQMTDMTECPHY